MDVQGLLAADTGAPLGESRARVLDLLHAAGKPLGVQEIAERSGLHPNTARFHLDALVSAGLATREPQPRETPGRPSMVYRVTEADGPTGQRRYRLLAEMLTSMITGVMPEPGEAAAEAGREWGRYLTEQPPPFQRVDAAEAIRRLTGALEEIGFAPEAVPAEGGFSFRLHQCPFREIAERHQDVVCSLHLGIMQGVLEQLRAPLTADELHPFAEPSVCIADLSTESGQAAESGRRPAARRSRR